MVVPDFAGWRREHMPVLPSTPAFTMAPDWVCEVVPPTTGYIDRGRKMRIYTRAGVRHLWIVDPIARTIEAYELEDGRWVVASTHGGTDPVRVAPFEAIELDVARWWMPSEPAPAPPSR